MKAAGLMLMVAAVGQAADHEVTITGGTNDGHNYVWTVRNDSAVAIQAVKIPYCNADQVTGPEGWTAVPSHGLTAEVGRVSGIVTYEASSPVYALSPRASREFSLRVYAAGALRGQATVTVVFVDGTEESIAGVECPVVEPWFRRNFPLIGLAVTFLLFLGGAHLARRRRAKSNAGPGGTGEDGGAAVDKA